MEESQARKLPPSDYQISYNLAHQPYSMPEQDDLPLEEDANVVPMPKSRATYPASAAIDPIVEDPLLPRSSAKRKQIGTSKGRTPPPKSKATNSYHPPANAKQPFADELQHLEELAERINYILAERARTRAIVERSQPPPRPGDNPPRTVPPYSHPTPSPQAEPYPALEAADTESLKRQVKRIRQRVSQLEVMMETDPDTWSTPPVATPAVDYPRSSVPQPTPRTVPPSPPVYAPHQNPFDPAQQRSEYEAWRAAEELRQLNAYQTQVRKDRRDRATQPTGETILRQWLSRLPYLSNGQLMQLPRNPFQLLTDALKWIVVATAVRMAAQLLVMSFPALAPMVTGLMLAPALLAIVLVVFAPKLGWIPFYRLFLVMLGLFIGGKII